MAEQSPRSGLGALLREDLRGETAYGAPQLSVRAALNTNENSYPVPDEVVADMLAELAAELPGLNRYPDREFTALREALAAYLSRGGTPVEAGQVWAGNGSNEVLLHLLQAFGGTGRRAIGFTPSYSMHSIIATTTATQWIAGKRSDDPARLFTLDPESVAAQIVSADPNIVFICSPNNPTGTAVGLDVVEAAYAAAPGAVVVVDEAYGEFARAGTPSALTLLAGRERLVVTRTMSKAFALAGGRLGYLAADPGLVDLLRLVRMPYHLSTQSQAVARAALRHADLMLSTVGVVKEQRDRLVTELTRLGYAPVPSDANFVLFGGLADAAVTWQALLDRGVLVRDVGIPHYLRVTAGTPEETTDFLEVLAALGPEHLLDRGEAN
ncbi:putative Histidinol-phosphate aminotransferase (hisC) [Nostocoides australiense Ben110]|uniref:Histidinol-phosphate aminotransferase n=1 Tax=Nostocoides australiense Ben110 TaxID=1193182 RepID=W6K3I5_9MICO|nr:histidinol-phosphate transaminase [Tetrasphaera australiensis]CCH73324.1 putative Histidinol-phosphate aminotransferase (hisC) [Tetrasphaera australiensis Ben110]